LEIRKGTISAFALCVIPFPPSVQLAFHHLISGDKNS
jgi:hypothetical protein